MDKRKKPPRSNPSAAASFIDGPAVPEVAPSRPPGIPTHPRAPVAAARAAARVVRRFPAAERPGDAAAERPALAPAAAGTARRRGGGLRRRRLLPWRGRRDFLRARQERRGRRARRGGAGREDRSSHARGWRGRAARRVGGASLAGACGRGCGVLNRLGGSGLGGACGGGRQRRAGSAARGVALPPCAALEFSRLPEVLAGPPGAAAAPAGAAAPWPAAPLSGARRRLARRLRPLGREFGLDRLRRRFGWSWRRLFWRRRSWRRWPAGDRGPSRASSRVSRVSARGMAASPRLIPLSTSRSFGPPMSSRCSVLSRRTITSWRSRSSSNASTISRRRGRLRGPLVRMRRPNTSRKM